MAKPVKYPKKSRMRTERIRADQVEQTKQDAAAAEAAKVKAALEARGMSDEQQAKVPFSAMHMFLGANSVDLMHGRERDDGMLEMRYTLSDVPKPVHDVHVCEAPWLSETRIL